MALGIADSPPSKAKDISRVVVVQIPFLIKKSVRIKRLWIPVSA